MAKKEATKKTKVLKTLSAKATMRRTDRGGALYFLGNSSGRGSVTSLCADSVARALKGTICPPGKTATVKITIEVEAIE